MSEPEQLTLLTLRAMVARFAQTGPVLGMAAQGMVQNTVTLLRAADTIGPPGTRWRREGTVSSSLGSGTKLQKGN